ncbi:S66 peptidase family protein [Acidicapsa acidisoli]|uniref:S66 peptidase family protein n=1 Tax=Acidicapsa acidisoli TaxID=1615681 RepID=UPI0021DFB936|nr:LD-carboxypeptidase [Acidicapsa acidisoli]
MADLLKPRAAAVGVKVAVLSPASSPDPAKVDRGMEALRNLGFLPIEAPHMLTRGPLYFAGTTEQRLLDLHAAFADDTVRVVFATRGGYGANYLLEGLDMDVLGDHPKPLFGYSDLTALQITLLDTLNLPSFHGPMVSPDFGREDGVHLPSLLAALAGEPYRVGKAEGLRLLKAGAEVQPVRGTLYGGCLSILTTLLGTAFEPQTEGKLLFLEDVSAKPFQIDRMLWQLKQSEKLDGVKGIIFGEMLDCVSPGGRPDLLEEVILNALDDFEGPIVIGLRSGHVSRANVTLTFGVQAELVATLEPELRLLEPAVAR